MRAYTDGSGDDLTISRNTQAKTSTTTTRGLAVVISITTMVRMHRVLLPILLTNLVILELPIPGCTNSRLSSMLHLLRDKALHCGTLTYAETGNAAAGGGMAFNNNNGGGGTAFNNNNAGGGTAFNNNNGAASQHFT